MTAWPASVVVATALLTVGAVVVGLGRVGTPRRRPGATGLPAPLPDLKASGRETGGRAGPG